MTPRLQVFGRRTRLDHLALLDRRKDDPVVEMLDRDRTARECGEKVELNFVDQVVPSSLEPRVRLLLHDDDHVSRHRSRGLVGFAAEDDRLAFLHALVNVDLQHLPLVLDLFPVARLAPVLVRDDLALAPAIRADLLHLLDHWAELPECHLDALALAGHAALDGRGLAGTFAVALCAEDVLLKGDLGRLASEQLLEGDFDPVNEVFALLRAAWSSASATTELHHRARSAGPLGHRA